MSSTGSTRELTVRLTIFSYVNALVISAFGWFHPWSLSPAASLLNIQPYAIPWVIVQGVVVVTPFWCLALIAVLPSRKALLGFIVIATAPVCYLVDLLAWLAVDGSLFEGESWILAGDATKWSIQNLSPTRFFKPACILLLYGAGEIVLARLCWRSRLGPSVCY